MLPFEDVWRRMLKGRGTALHSGPYSPKCVEGTLLGRSTVLTAFAPKAAKAPGGAWGMKENSMKANVQDTYGSPEVLELREIDKPVVKDDEVLTRFMRRRSTKGKCNNNSGG
jgi:hypothetical protein